MVRRRRPEATPPATEVPGVTTAPRPRQLDIRWLASIFGLAFLVRAAFAVQLGQEALFRQPQLDAREFLIWARGILAQGFSWPSLPTKGPGYAVFLAGLLRVTGESLPAVRLIQAVLGAVTAVLVALLANRWGGRRVALVAGLLVAVYTPLVFVEVSLLAEGPFLSLLVAALLVYPGAAGEGRLPGWARGCLVGLLLGLASLVRATALPLIPAFALLTFFDRRWSAPAGRARNLGPALSLLAAGLAVVLPVTAAMSRSTGSRFLVQGYGGLNLYMGNVGPDGRAGGPGTPWARLGGDWDELQAKAIAAGATTAAAEDRYFVAAARRAIASDPLAWLGVLGRKVLWLLSADEVRESHSWAFFGSRQGGWPLLGGFCVLGPLALCGLVAAVRRRRLPGELAIYLALFAATCIGIIAGARYRLPLIPVLAVFAAGAAVEIYDLLRRRAWRQAVPWLLGLVVAAAGTLAIRHAPSHDFAEEWAMTGAAERELGDPRAAEAAYRQAIAVDPQAALGWASLGGLLLDERRTDEAATALARAVELNPRFVLARYEAGRLALAQGQAEAAARSFEAALALQPEHLPSLALLGPLLVRLGEVEKATPVLERLARLEPSNVEAQLGLARLAGARRQPAVGLGAARRATELAPERLDVWMTELFLALDAGDTATATSALARARALAGDRPGPELDWAAALLLRLSGRGEELDGALRQLLARWPDFAPARSLLLVNARQLGREAAAAAFLAGLRSPAGSP